MKPRPDLSIVIPAFNEEARLGPTLRDYVARAMDAPEDVVGVVRAAIGNSRPSFHPSQDQVKDAAKLMDKARA